MDDIILREYEVDIFVMNSIIKDINEFIDSIDKKISVWSQDLK